MQPQSGLYLSRFWLYKFFVSFKVILQFIYKQTFSNSGLWSYFLVLQNDS